ncbi:hypothetical protein [uncultured Phycicoccus sp.]|uniref:hypothetical protein n=1 Tax=uncultured Phycicoccus sp. TaxID=661422 RepID=UPI00263A0C18|nr:hypothetical protein [uncultured Phycicoccus sp.]
MPTPLSGTPEDRSHRPPRRYYVPIVPPRTPPRPPSGATNPYRDIAFGSLFDPTAPPHDDETLRELCRGINWSREHTETPVMEGVAAMLLQHAMRALHDRGLDPWSWCDGRETGVPPLLED